MEYCHLEYFLGITGMFVLNVIQVYQRYLH